MYGTRIAGHPRHMRDVSRREEGASAIHQQEALEDAPGTQESSFWPTSLISVRLLNHSPLPLDRFSEKGMVLCAFHLECF